MKDTGKDIDSKRIFFLYPDDVTREKIIKEILLKEYEAYPLNSHMIALSLLEEFNYSILLINIDDRSKVPE